jgi:multimeric flavodoxin WrbA
MFSTKTLILEGFAQEDESSLRPLSVLTSVLENAGAGVTRHRLRDMNLAHCKGCFDCWIQTPGMCSLSDTCEQILQDVILSDMTILFTPVTFGGYSSVLKRAVDRFIPLILPFFGRYLGETHHTPRYSSYPRLVGIGVQSAPDKADADLFKSLVGRNALNFHAPSFAAEVVSDEDDPEILHECLERAVSRFDPCRKEVRSAYPENPVEPEEQNGPHPGRALLIIGSPKIKNRSTSSILGKALLHTMERKGWETESLTLKTSLERNKGQAELCTAVDRSDLIILALPLYVDALPYLVTKALEIIHQHKKHSGNLRHQRLFTLINNGFPEYEHNALALAMCRRFADQSGLVWAGSLAMGAGEAIGGGQELTDPKRSGPPSGHILQALDQAGRELSAGRSVSREAQRLMSKTPLPCVPEWIWRRLFPKFGVRWWKLKAREYGMGRQDMLAKPYAD